MWSEFGIPSVYTGAENFWKIFSEDSRAKNGYFGVKTFEDELNKVRNPLERLLCEAVASKTLSEKSIHDACVCADELGFHYFDGVNASALSVQSKNLTLDVNQINRNTVTIVNRAHYFSLPNISTLKKKHYKSLLERLTPADEHKSKISADFLDFKEKHKFTYAVHLRKTDYKNYLNGKYYFTDQQYAHVCRTISKHLNGEVGFAIFSDEEINNHEFSDLPTIIVRGTAEADIIAMSQCNAIIGPPSSFGNLASFLGESGRILIRGISEFEEQYKKPESLINRRCFPYVA
jgi:hypothetical protein